MVRKTEIPPTPTSYTPPTPIVPPTPEIPEQPVQPAQPQTPALPNTGTESSTAAVLAGAMTGLLRTRSCSQEERGLILISFVHSSK